MINFSNLFSKKKLNKSSGYQPPYLKKARAGGAASEIRDESINRTNQDLTQLRFGQDTKEIVREFSKVSPDLSHSLNTLSRFIITDSYTVFAKNLETDAIDEEGTRAAKALVTRLDKLPPGFDGFYQQSSFNATAETLLYQLFCNGDMMAELVLDKARLPSKIQPISTNNLKFEAKGDRVVPFIDEGGESTYLDFPTVKAASLNQDPETPYASSFFESAIQAIIASEEYRNDIRRAFRKASLPRVTAEIDHDKFKKSLSPDVQYDGEKMAAAMAQVIQGIEDQLNGLNPEDCIVSFDTVKVSHLSQGNTSTHESLKVHSDIMNGLVSTGLKVLPSILGRGQSQSTASTEAVLLLKMVENIQVRLNELYSSLITTGLRLLGHDVVVIFKYKKPDLRPELELESFLAMKQSRILEQLSLGYLTDLKASIMLTGDLPPEGYTPLSGTGFHKNSVDVENPYSGTSVGGEQLNKTKVQNDLDEGKTSPKSNQTTG